MPAPITPRQKCPSNFNFGFFRVVTIKTRGSNDLLSYFIQYNKGSTGFQGLPKKDFEHVFFIAIARRMLFPYERVGCDSKKIAPIFRLERAKLDEFAF